MSISPAPIPRIRDAFGQAVEAASRFRGATAPNPPVGCTILDRDGRVLAVAAHARAGGAHAEAAALAICARDGTSTAIDTVVVTLEPCNHWGRTPPCAEAILGTSARTIWIGVPDPNRSVVGGGAARLRAAGLDVRILDDEEPELGDALRECRELIAPFAKRQRTGRPWVTVKQALDRNGSMIPPAGRTTFTSEKSLALAHALRRRSDAILTGSGTVLADDPAFTVRRVADHPGRRRRLLVLDRRGRVPDAYLAAAEERGFAASRIGDLGVALDDLGSAGALEVLVEAGPALTASVIDAALWDEHVVIRQGLAGQDDLVEVRRAHREGAAMPAEAVHA